MESSIPEAETNEESETEHERKQPSAQWKKVFSGAWQDFSPRYFSNLLFLVIGLLVAPAVGVLMNKPKIVIAGFALGVTILIWVGAVLLMKHAGQASSGEPPSVSDTEATRRVNTPDIPRGEPNPAPTTPETIKPPTPDKEKPVMTDKKTKQSDSVKQKNITANTNIQAGRDVHYHPPEEKRHVEERRSGPIGFHVRDVPSTNPEPLMLSNS